MAALPHDIISRPAGTLPNNVQVSQPVQWANCRNTSLYFTMIAATKCAVLLVCSNGKRVYISRCLCVPLDEQEILGETNWSVFSRINFGCYFNRLLLNTVTNMLVLERS